MIKYQSNNQLWFYIYKNQIVVYNLFLKLWIKISFYNFVVNKYKN